MHRRNELAVVLAAPAALTLAACGSGADDAAGSASGNAGSTAPTESDTSHAGRIEAAPEVCATPIGRGD